MRGRPALREDLVPREDAVVRWRRIALDKQLPAPHFPAGVGVPATVCCWALVLVAVLCAVLFGAAAGRRVPQAVVDSQQQLVSGLARVLDNALDASVDALEEAAGQYAEGTGRDPAKLLDGLNAGTLRWTGLTVLDGATRKPLAARGEPVAAAELNTQVKRTTVKPSIVGAEPRVLVAVPLVDGRLLAGVRALRVQQLRLDPAQQQAVLVALASGDARHVQGADPSADRDVMSTVRQAVRATADGDRASRTAAAAGPAGTALVVVAAPVGDSGLAVASAVRTPIVDAGPRWLGVVPALGLLLSAGAAFLLFRLGLARPVRRLLQLAKASACGDALPKKSTAWKLSEARRIAAALVATPANRLGSAGQTPIGPAGQSPTGGGGRRAAGTAGRRGRRAGTSKAAAKRRGRVGGVSALVAVAAATWVVVVWSIATVIAFAGGASSVPAQVVKDTGNQIESVSAALGDVLDSGRVQLAAAAAQPGVADQAALRSALDRLTRQDSRYRSVYLADAGGRSRLRVGREPLRRERALPDGAGVQLDNTSGRFPIIYAYTRLTDGRGLVAEFDVSFLARLLERIDGHVRVVDPQLHTILDTEGYRAFQRMPDGASRAAMVDGRPDQTQAKVLTAGGLNPVLVSSTALSNPTSAARLKWTVVAERPVSDLSLPPNDLRRAALLAAGAATVLALVSLGWHYFVLLRPLRRLATAAAHLSGGDTGTVISPQRHDEIGAIAACLEICRQVQVHGERRLGGAARLRGSDNDFTTVMTRIPAYDDRTILAKDR